MIIATYPWQQAWLERVLPLLTNRSGQAFWGSVGLMASIQRAAPLTSTICATVQHQETTDHASDSADIQAARLGDPDAFARLVRRHQPAVTARMWRFTRNRGELEELVHDTFVEAWMSLPTYRKKAPLAHWLAKIATRVGYRFWKQNRRSADAKKNTPLNEIADKRDPTGAVDAAEQVHALLARLPARDRLVLTLLYLEECTIEEAAKLSGWSKSLVKVQAYRARKKLARLLNASGAQS